MKCCNAICALCVCYLSLITMFVRLLHVIVCISSLLSSFNAKYHSVVGIYHNLLLQPVDGYFSYFYFGAVINKVVINIFLLWGFLQTFVFISLMQIPRSRNWGHEEGECLTSWETGKWISKVIALCYTPTGNEASSCSTSSPMFYAVVMLCSKTFYIFKIFAILVGFIAPKTFLIVHIEKECWIKFLYIFCLHFYIFQFLYFVSETRKGTYFLNSAKNTNHKRKGW